MPTRNNDLKDRLSRYREITVSVTGRKSGRTISNPVWFVFDGGKLYFCRFRIRTRRSAWYKNVLNKPSIHVGRAGHRSRFQSGSHY